MEVARIIGFLLLGLWVFFLFVAKKQIRTMPDIVRATLFQWNILPFLVATGLITTGSFYYLLFGMICMIFSVPFIQLCMATIPMLHGIFIGIYIGFSICGFGLMGISITAGAGAIFFLFSVPTILAFLGINIDSDRPDSPFCDKSSGKNMPPYKNYPIPMLLNNGMLESYPWLCLHFDTFEELSKHFSHRSTKMAFHKEIPLTRIPDILQDEFMFFHTWESGHLKIPDNNGCEMDHAAEESLWEHLISESNEEPDQDINFTDPVLEARRKKRREYTRRITDALRIRYDIPHGEKTSDRTYAIELRRKERKPSC